MKVGRLPGRRPLPWRLLMAVWKYAFGVLLCLTPVTAILTVGWTYRLMQRSTLKRWHRLSGFGADGTRFVDFALADSRTSEHVGWPNWLFGTRDAEWRIDGGPGRVMMLPKRIAGSFWANLRTGIQASLNTALLVLPCGALWLLSWWGGWQNSFHKGYEQAWVGPVVGILGIVLFILVMTYVPMAQARQAAAGTWRAFWDFPLIRRLLRRRRLSGLGLAILYGLAAAPILGVKVAPMIMGEQFEGLTAAELEAFANRYYLLGTAALFPLHVLVRLAAARYYARAMFDCVRAGEVQLEELSPYEREALGRLRVAAAPSAPRHPVGRLAASLPRAIIVVLTFAAWFGIAAQLYIAQFLNYAWFNWLNHPLILLPWIRYLPGQG